jgi:hypothetical protein
MGITVCLPLFGNPGHELEVDEGDPAKSKDLRRLGDALRDRLAKAADDLDKVNADGWSAHLGMYDLILTHPDVDTRAMAEDRLRAIGIDPAELLIVEDVEDEEDIE